MSFNVGGLYVRSKKGVDVAAVIAAITESWTKRGAKVDDKGDPRTLESLGLEDSGRLGYGLCDAGDWIVVAESEQYMFDHGIATHVAKKLGVECLWYGMFGATGHGVAQRFGNKPSRVSGYGEVEELISEMPMAFSYYGELPKRGITYVGFTKVKQSKYEYGPIEEDDELPEPAAKAPKADTKAKKAPFKPVRVRDKKDLLVRDAFMLAWFLDGSIAKTRRGIARALDRYVAFVPENMLRWSLLGSSSTTVRAFSDSTVSRAHAMLKKADAYFWLGSDDEPETAKPQKDEPHCPAFLLHVNAGKEPLGTLEMRFTSDFVWQVGIDAMVKFAAEVTKELPVLSGYGSLELAMHPMITTYTSKQERAIRPIALDHIGYDVAKNDSTAFTMRKQSGLRGARWLTIVGPKFAVKVKPALAKTGAELIAAGKNLVVRAGAEPQPDPDPAAIGKVAKALLPVMLDDNFVSRIFDDPKTGDLDPLTYAGWEFRFAGGIAGAIAHLDARKDRAGKVRLLAIRIGQGNYAAASKAFAVAVKAGAKDKDLGRELLAMSELAEAAKRRDDAVAWMLRLQKSDPSNHYTTWSLGELYQRLGKKAEAATQFAAYKKAEGDD